MPERRLRLFFLWHLHQPWYLVNGDRVARLPWVRLHALKNYGDLPRLLTQDPRVPHVVNLVPSLLDQLELVASGHASDTFLELVRRPIARWTAEDVSFALANLFSAHETRLIAAVPRYAELLLKRQRREPFAAADLRDLAVLFHLAWSGTTLSRSPVVAALKEKGRAFTEDDKDALLAAQSTFLKGVLPGWRDALATGVIEGTTSPYHHPILPLLIDGGTGRDAVPDLPLPTRRLRRPGDAALQLARGLASFERHFERPARGMWPPEGAISADALAAMAKAGVVWTASDVEILRRSHPGPPFVPYRTADGPVVFFRDRVLSDRIGFTYASWPAKDAAADFVERLHALRADPSNVVVPIILDGENPWEAYPDNGEPFLHALTTALADAPDLEVTTPSRLLEELEPRPLPHVVAGSWVDGTLRTWIGGAEKNRAWDLLADAAAPVADGEPPDALLAAEASDWFWWFGDDHTSAHDADFDALFRAHLGAAHRARGAEPPRILLVPIAHQPDAVPAAADASPIDPRFDGSLDGWAGAGVLVTGAGGAMARAETRVKRLLYGGDAQGRSLFLRVEATKPPAQDALRFHLLRVELLLPHDLGTVAYELSLLPGEQDGPPRVVVGDAIEVSIPRPRGETTAFRATLLDKRRHELEPLGNGDFTCFRVAGHVPV